MSNQAKPREIKCPQCGKLTAFSSENPYRPFCSERCKTNDLGAWADESYRIPVVPSSSDSLSVDLDGDDYDDSENRH
jgi:endogenous inhibitor of DNA gyrase (YacG/DUF329 family)